MFLPSKHSDLGQNFAVLWRLEWEPDFWLGKPNPTPNNSSALGRYFPFAHLAKMPDTEPLALAARFTYSVLQDEQQVMCCPQRAEGHSAGGEIYRVFPTAPLAPKQARMPVSQWQVLVVSFLKRCMRW